MKEAVKVIDEVLDAKLGEKCGGDADNKGEIVAA
jgi:hypothetical protein